MRMSCASLLTGTLLLGATACDDRPLVVVEVAPLPTDAAELYVSLSYRGHPARKPAPIRFDLRDQRLDEPATFGVRLESQTDGDLVVGAGVFDGGGCLSAFGGGTADRISVTPRLALTLIPAPVESLSHAERCQMPELTPLLLSISPARASTAGGERVVLRGWGFGTDSCSLVRVNGTKVTDTVCRSLVELDATIPPSSQVGPAQVQVVNPSSSGDRQVISTTLFSYYAQSIHLGTPTAYPVDAGPVALVSGRIDRDQRPDLVVVSRDVGTVTILINNGLGGFPSGFRTTLPAGVRPTSAGLGDLNGDGLADVLVTSANDDVSVHLQNQPMVPAAFSPPSHVFVNLLPSGIALGDLNGDGVLDAAIANQLSSDVSLLLNDGHGKVVRSAAGDLAVPREPVAVELVDLNRDRKPDLVVRSAVSSSLTVLLSRDSSFLAYSRRDYPLSSAPAALVMVDLDGDQAAEAVVALKDGTVRVLWNDGRGALGQDRESRVAVALDTTALGVGDLDLDGSPDVLAATGAEQRLYVLRNTGLAGGLRELQPGAGYPAARRPSAIAVADFDGDLLPDVAVADAAQSAVSVFLNQSK